MPACGFSGGYSIAGDAVAGVSEEIAADAATGNWGSGYIFFHFVKNH
jgi:nitrogen regulatory protein PII